MRELSFKSKWYRMYSPYLYKMVRLKAKFDLFRWKINKSELDSLSSAYWMHYISKRMANEARFFGCKPYSEFRMPKKNGDRVYVLGCGSSINNVALEEWATIEKHFSIGLNMFHVHDFTPNLYFSEFHEEETFNELFNDRAVNRITSKKYDLLISANYISLCSENSISPKGNSPFLYPKMPIKTKNKTVLCKLAREYFFSKKGGVVLHQISNLDSVINFCVRSGFKDIRLVGVDLYDHEYFFENGDGYNYRRARKVIEASGRSHLKEKKSSKEHATASKDVSDDLGNISIVEYLEMLQKDILDKKNIKIKVANPKSLLANVLEVQPISE